MSHKDKQVIDYAWDARIDSILQKSDKGIDPKSISIKSYSYKLNPDEEKMYLNNRSDLKYMLLKAIRKMV